MKIEVIEPDAMGGKGFTFINPEQNMGVAISECHNACLGVIISTTNGGTHWTPQDAMVIGQAIIDMAKKALG